jgi:hypothetical protein
MTHIIKYKAEVSDWVRLPKLPCKQVIIRARPINSSVAVVTYWDQKDVPDSYGFFTGTYPLWPGEAIKLVVRSLDELAIRCGTEDIIFIVYDD